MRITLIALFFLLSLCGNAQSSRKKQKISYAQGTIFASWGINRTAYGKSDIRFVGNDYDFTLADAKAHDNPSFKVPQYNVRVGYYFAHHWAISVGVDHFKYVFADQNNVFLNGSINPGFDTSWTGDYTNEAIVTDRSTFHYENAGMNYLRAELTRTDQWFFAGRDQEFVFSTNFGLGGGPILSENDFLFAGRETKNISSMSGFGLSFHTGLRFEFFRHFYLQPQGSLGFINQRKVKTTPGLATNYATQKFIYAEMNITAGLLFYLRTKNGCNSCPHW